eukprot:659920-Pleurochrysis_carterae.AAC.4
MFCCRVLWGSKTTFEGNDGDSTKSPSISRVARMGSQGASPSTAQPSAGIAFPAARHTVTNRWSIRTLRSKSSGDTFSARRFSFASCRCLERMTPTTADVRAFALRLHASPERAVVRLVRTFMWCLLWLSTSYKVSRPTALSWWDFSALVPKHDDITPSFWVEQSFLWAAFLELAADLILSENKVS